MMTLLYKELRLAAHPASLVFACLGCLVLVPAYPYSVIFLFGCLAPYITLVNARETNDLWYTAILPVSITRGLPASSVSNTLKFSNITGSFLPGRSRHLSGSAELRKLFFIQHSKTSLIFSAGIAP